MATSGTDVRTPAPPAGKGEGPRISRVYIITYCRDLDLLYGSTLVFGSLRVGFPESEIVVIDNASLPEARAVIRNAAKGAGALFEEAPPGRRHHELLREIVRTADVPFAVVDPDVIFWSRFDQAGSGLIEGRLIPTFRDPYTQCLTHERLHTSLLKIQDPSALRSAIEQHSRFFEFDPIAPVMVHRAGVWERFDTMGGIYSLLKASCRSFTIDELDHYDHLFCGSHADQVTETLGDAAGSFEAIHQAVRSKDFQSIKGAWKQQQLFFQTLALTGA